MVKLRIFRTRYWTLGDRGFPPVITDTLQQYDETPQADDYDGPTTYSWQDVPVVEEWSQDSGRVGK